MFAVIKTGGKQYRVRRGQVSRSRGVKGEPGDDRAVRRRDDARRRQRTLGSPTVSGASVAAEVLEHGRGAKVIAFKKRRRKNSRRKRGHRQEFTLIRITEILTDGAKPTKGAAAEARKEAGEAAPAEDEDAERASRRRRSQGKSQAAKAASAKKPAAKKPGGGKSESKRQKK